MLTMHIKKQMILQMIFETYKIPYDEVVDDGGAIVAIVPRQKGVLVTWEGSDFEVVC